MSNEKQARPDFITSIITPVFRLSYPHLFEATYNKLAKRNEFSLVMLFDKKTAINDLKELKALMAKVATFRFGASPKGLLNPLKDGDTTTNEAGELLKERNPSYEGMMVLRSWSKNQPGVVNSKSQIILDSDEVYGGCYCKAQLNCYAYEAGKNRGVSFGLMNIQKIKDGEPFGNRTRPEDAFAPIQESESQAEDVAAESMFG